jgi:hypothetical protein
MGATIGPNEGRKKMKIVSGILVALLLCAPWIAISPVNAQGTSGTLPGPMSSRMLNRCADRLDLSKQQRLALLTLHEDYKRDFSILRRGDIAVFLDAQTKAQGGIPEREKVDALLDDLRRIHAKIKALDDALFDRLGPLLTDAQLEALPRIRQVRERDRYRPQMTMMLMGQRLPDLSDLVYEADLQTPLPVETELLLQSYERNLTSRMRKQSKAISEITSDLMDALAERGYGTLTQEQILQDPELLQQLMADMQTIWGELQADAASLTVEMRELNQRTIRRLCETLSYDTAGRLRSAFLRSAYPQTGGLVNLRSQPWLDLSRHESLEAITPDQRKMLAIEADVFLRKLSALEDQLVAVLNAYFDNISVFDPAANQASNEQLQADLARLQQDAAQLNERTLTHLHTALDEEAWLALQQRTAEDVQVEAAPVVTETTALDDTTTDYRWSGDTFLPSRIGRRENFQYARRLGFDEALHEVVAALHEDYVTSFADLKAILALQEARQTMIEQRQGDADIDRAQIMALRLQSINEIEALEAMYFDQIIALCDDTAASLVERLRAERLASILRGSASTSFSLGLDRSEAAKADLLAIITRQPWAPRRDELIGPAIDEHLAALVPLLRERLTSQLELDRFYERWSIEISKAASTDLPAIIETQQRFNQLVAGPVAWGSHVDAKVIASNEEAVDAISKQLPTQDAVAFRRQYNAAAYPEVYRDESAVGTKLDATMELYDLTTDQRAQLGDVVLQYRSEYERLSDAMVALHNADTAFYIGIDQEQLVQWQQRQQTFEQLWFERNELNAQVIGRLQSVLNTEQVHRIGGLPEMQAQEDRTFWQ